MAKIAVITDTHFGVREDHAVLVRHMAKFYRERFFPTLKERGVEAVLHLGDIMDRRKTVSYVTLRNFREQFLKPIQDMNLELHVVIGNHDTYFKNTNDVNCMEELGTLFPVPDTVKWYTKPQDIVVGGAKFFVIPWVCPENRPLMKDAVAASTARIAVGHLELGGFEMYAGHRSEHGLSEVDEFHKFDQVWSGHYHHKSNSANIHYLGAPYEMTWSDYDDPRGFHIFDTDTGVLEYIQTKDHLFDKIVYSDDGKDANYATTFNYASYTDKFVRVYVTEKVNPYTFELFLSKLVGARPADHRIIESATWIDQSETDEVSADDTPSIIRKAVEGVVGVDKSKLGALMMELFNEANKAD